MHLSAILRNGLNDGSTRNIAPLIVGRLCQTADRWIGDGKKVVFDHLLRSDESLSEKWAYLRQNPVRAGLVVNADGWPYQFQFNEAQL
jgi:hypothetical protein